MRIHMNDGPTRALCGQQSGVYGPVKITIDTGQVDCKKCLKILRGIDLETKALLRRLGKPGITEQIAQSAAAVRLIPGRAAQGGGN